ncbi:MAG: selenium cofactor biosynthesis protein YqeC [Dehalococcoidia bacterium]|nr:selenium cofactor biosynthesis protein YqeC [Dehalococcoidia bacterium]
MDRVSLAEQSASLMESFGLAGGEVISLVGAGGKTTLMYALAKEMARDGRLAVTTTTTKILAPSAEESDLLFLDEEENLLYRVAACRGHRRVVTAVRRSLGSGKLEGVSSEFVDQLSLLGGFSGIIVEADGAARCSLKAPNATEPVIPESTTVVIAVSGMEKLGCPLDYDHVFRAEIAADLLGIPLGSVMGPEEIAKLITHPRGIAKGTPSHARIVPLLNQVDLDGDLRGARLTAQAILSAGHPQIDRVVVGEARKGKFLVLELAAIS